MISTNVRSKNKHARARLFILAGVALITWGLIAPYLKIYFFWEAVTFGIFALLIGGILYLLKRIPERRQKLKNVFWERLSIVVFTVWLVGIPLILTLISQSEAYATAKNYFKQSMLQNEIGEIKGFWLNSASISESDGNGTASFNMLVKGKLKYQWHSVTLTRIDGMWVVSTID